MVRRDARTGSVAVRAPSELGARVVQVVIVGVGGAILVAGVGLVLWLLIDAFRVSASAGARSMCAVLIPLLACCYISFVRRDWLDLLEKIPNLGVFVGSAFGAVGVITALSAGSGSNVLPQLAISFAFSTMLLTVTVGDRPLVAPFGDEKLIHFFFGIALALTLFGLFRLEG